MEIETYMTWFTFLINIKWHCWSDQAIPENQYASSDRYWPIGDHGDTHGCKNDVSYK